MWKTLHQLAMPPRLYQLCGYFVPWLAVACVLVLATGWIWGFGFAPADYQQGQSYRIIYLHVPAAIWSMGIYASMAVAAFIGLVWQMKMANLALAAMAPIGAVFTFIALVTGSAWGKPMWGTWWVWDRSLFGGVVEHAASGLDPYATKHRSGHAHAAAAGDCRLSAAVYHAVADADA